MLTLAPNVIKLLASPVPQLKNSGLWSGTSLLFYTCVDSTILKMAKPLFFFFLYFFFFFKKVNDMMSSLGTSVSQRPVARTLCPEAHSEVSIAVCATDVQQHTWTWGPKYRHRFQGSEMSFYHLEYRSRENKQQTAQIKYTSECDVLCWLGKSESLKSKKKKYFGKISLREYFWKKS